MGPVETTENLLPPPLLVTLTPLFPISGVMAAVDISWRTCSPQNVRQTKCYLLRVKIERSTNIATDITDEPLAATRNTATVKRSTSPPPSALRCRAPTVLVSHHSMGTPVA